MINKETEIEPDITLFEMKFIITEEDEEDITVDFKSKTLKVLGNEMNDLESATMELCKKRIREVIENVMTRLVEEGKLQ